MCELWNPGQVLCSSEPVEDLGMFTILILKLFFREALSPSNAMFMPSVFPNVDFDPLVG